MNGGVQGKREDKREKLRSERKEINNGMKFYKQAKHASVCCGAGWLWNMPLSVQMNAHRPRHATAHMHGKGCNICASVRAHRHIHTHTCIYVFRLVEIQQIGRTRPRSGNRTRTTVVKNLKSHLLVIQLS